MFYSPEATETLVSPTDIVTSSNGLYTSWTHISHCNTGRGSLEFWSWTGIIHHCIPLVMKNCLWYFEDLTVMSTLKTAMMKTNNDAIHTVHGVTLYELWHNCLGHLHHQLMSQIHNHAHGVPSLKICNPFFKSCATAPNLTKKMRGYNCNPKHATAPNQRFHMDFGFVKASNAKGKEKITVSREGYSSYLLIVDEYSRMIWVFLTKSKAAPIKIVDNFLATYKITQDSARFKQITVEN